MKAPLGTPSIRFEQAIYFTSASPAVHMLMDDVLHRHEQAGLDAHYTVLTNLSGEYTPFSGDMLKMYGRGLTPAELAAYPHAKQAVLVTFGHPRSERWRGLKHSAEVMEDAARATGGWIVDRETTEVFNVDEWHRRRLSRWTDELTSVGSQTTIDVYDSGEYKRAVTLGMKKFGLPDIAVTGFVATMDPQVVDVINLVSQAMAEGVEVGPRGTFNLDVHTVKHAAVRDRALASFKNNGTGIAHLTLVEAKHDEGDADNRIAELSSETYRGNDSHAQLEAMLTTFFGATDKTESIDHSEEVLAASRKAREHLPELRATFNAGLKASESIMVKAPFKMDDGGSGNEWMWVEVTHWDGHSIRGLLMNAPVHVRSLHAGQAVEVDDEKVFDYVHTLPDGRREGNTTAAIIGKQSR
jgi:uncharacterized protein YegJ (DUF2314 family)